ncbi:thiamine pyrophosphate-dependent dehydrogenase E1 component subunit alpha [Nocardia sp. NPDC059177]|uniref:thiamine pyrophosphate-dependent dehydrogenase E1 component subunit alpha n=1 Tax=Nocardia sp. NPDC059177 TaxID=3346759 RepID=UPI0036A80576
MTDHAASPIRLLTPDGKLCPNDLVTAEISADLCRDLYRKMVLARRFDAEALALQRQGELGLWLQCAGQEAAQVGSICALDEQDYVFPSYREHAAALCRGITPREILAQWRGSSHSGWAPDHRRFHITTLVLASQLLHATGYAMGIQRDGAVELTMAYFGDGASSQGDANEAFNWAAVAGAPVLFFCQNNQWAISTPASVQTRAPLFQRARGFGMEGYSVDGNDVLAVHAVTRLAAEYVRGGGGPALIEAVTYRMGGHSSADDPRRYRSDSDVDRWRELDPIDRLRRLLDNQGWADETFHAAVNAEGRELAAQARRDCLNLGAPAPDALWRNVMAHRTVAGREEREYYLRYAESFS